jgi:hypothetical protein
VVDSTDLGKWGTVTLRPPDFLEDIKNGVNTVAGFMNEVLDLLLTGLEIAKAFSVGYIDPISNLLQVLIDQINELLRNIAQIGIYLTGDWNLLKDPYEDIRGGFAAYEQRMVARLVDRGDPTRPDISSSEKVFAFFGYVSADISQIDQPIRTVRSLLKLFNADVIPTSATLPAPIVSPDPQYGSEAGYTGLVEAFQTTDVPDVVQVNWTAASSLGKAPQTQYPSQPPSGFLVAVSTVREGIRLSYDRPIRDGGKKPSDADPDEQVQIRESGYMLDNRGKPILLYGGDHTYSIPNDLSYWRSSQTRTTKNGVLVLKDGVTRVFGTLDVNNQIPINLDLLQGVEGEHYIQDLFYVGALSSPLSWTTDTYSIEFTPDQLPRHATFKQASDGSIELVDEGSVLTYYVRVATVTERIPSEETYQWDLDDVAKKRDNAGVPVNVNLTAFLTDGKRPTVGVDISDWSDPVEISFPSELTSQYMTVLETALTVFALSRPDLPTLTELGMGQELTFDGIEQVKIETPQTADQVYQAVMDGNIQKQVARQATGLEVYRDLYFKYFRDGLASVPPIYRKALLDAVRKAAQEIYQRGGSNPALEKTIVEATEELRTWTLGDILDRHADPLVRAMSPWFSSGNTIDDPTILEALESSSEEGGFAYAPTSIGLDQDTVKEWFYVPNVIIARLPQLIEQQETERIAWKEIAEMSDKLVLDAGDITRGQLKFVKAHGPRDPDTGRLIVRYEAATASTVDVRVELVRKKGPTDESPVIFTNLEGLDTITRALNLGDPNNEKSVGARGAVAFARTVFAGVTDNTIISQTRIVLGYATAAASRPREDSQWLALRYTSVFPSVDDVMTALGSWIGSINDSVKDTANALLSYIEFLEARITETQQYIRRVNAMINSFFPFAIPAMSGLLLLSSGTDGVLSDLVTAKNKPYDSPFAYGAGVAVLVPGIALVELFIEMFGFLGEDVEAPPVEELEADPIFVPVPTEELEAPSGDNDPPEVL